MQVLKITRSAYRVIEQESIKAEQKRTETGGLLIGTLKRLVVVKASRPGTAARVSSISYTGDSEYDNTILRRAIKEFNGRVKTVGYWHKHPGCMNGLSDGDLNQAHEIFRTNERAGDKRPVLFIVTNVIRNEVKLYCYYLAFDQKEFKRVSIKIVRDDSKDVKKALHQEPVVIQPSELNYWDSRDFQFYRTKSGYTRLKKEIDELKRHGYQVKVHAESQMYIVVKKDQTIVCFPPPEYPLNPPRFFKNNVEIKYQLLIWNSSFRIKDILNILEKQGGYCEGHNTKTSTKMSKIIKRCKRTIKLLWPYKRKRGTKLHS